MKTSNFFSSLIGWFAVAGLGLSAILVFGGCDGQKDPPSPPPTTGSLKVELEAYAGSSNSFPCENSTTGPITGTVTLQSASGGNQPKPIQWAFSGLSNNTSPACSTAVIFTDLQPGTWIIHETKSGVM